MRRLAVRLSKQGLEIVASTPDAFGRYVQAGTVKWARAVEASGAKLD
jgi:hypothetical protein